jgi:hypothetical protein
MCKCGSCKKGLGCPHYDIWRFNDSQLDKVPFVADNHGTNGTEDAPNVLSSENDLGWHKPTGGGAGGSSGLLMPIAILGLVGAAIYLS